MEMKVWICETRETDGYDYFGEDVTLWYKQDDALKHAQTIVDECTDPHTQVRFTVREVRVQ